MLIRAYGQFWNPDIVDWGSRGRGNQGSLSGKMKWDDGETVPVDCWNQRGIYVLYYDFKCVYLGRAFGQPIGKRLRDHLTDRFAGRWEMFSWYGIDTIKRNGELRRAGTRQINPKTLVDTVEALGIILADPPLNRRQESLGQARRVEQQQSPHPHTTSDYLQQILEKLDQIQDPD